MILGEFRRTIDDRYRISLPPELLAPLVESQPPGCLLAKERPGALSLWNASQRSAALQDGLRLIESKLSAGRLADRGDDLQRLGRLLSTRHREVSIAGRGRLLIPEGFREFLGVEAGGEVFVVGAALCLELWRPDAWLSYLELQIPEFGKLYDSISA